MKRIFAMLFIAVLLLLGTGDIAYAEEDVGSPEEDVVVGLSILTPPTRTEYAAFDTLDTEGLTVKVDLSSGESRTLTPGELVVEYLTDPDRLRYGDGGVYISYGDMRLFLPLEVNRRDYDLSGIVFSSVRCIYNGEWQRIELAHELPTGLDGLPLKARIEGRGQDVGVYNISLTFFTESRDYSTPEPRNARLEILPYRMEVEWGDVEFTYDGSPKLPQAFATDERGERIGLTVQGEGLFASDSYVAHAIAPSANYLLDGALTPYRIRKADYDVSGVYWSTGDFVYDGEEKEVTLSGLPDGVTLRGYTGNKACGAGAYLAVPVLSYDLRNYNPPSIPALDWEIKKASFDVSGVRWEGIEVNYDGSEHRAELVGLPDGVTIREYIGGVATNAGSYPVSAVLDFDEANYNPPEIASATLVIAKKVVPIPASKTVIFDGKEHRIDASAAEYYQKTTLLVKSIGKHGITLILRDPVNYAFADGSESVTVEVICRLSDGARMAVIITAVLLLLMLAAVVTALVLRRERLMRILSALRCRTTLAEEHYLPVRDRAEPSVLLSETSLSSVDPVRADSLISDSLAKSLITPEPEPIYTDGRRKCIINVDTLSDSFAAGERIDVNLLKERGLVPADTAFIKVLARGVIDKPLVVLANDFTPAAVKMLALTGGEARRVVTLRKKRE